MVRKTEHETNPCQAQALNVQVLVCVPETSRKMHSNIIPLKRVFFYKVSVGDGPGFKSSPRHVLTLGHIFMLKIQLA